MAGEKVMDFHPQPKPLPAITEKRDKAKRAEREWRKLVVEVKKRDHYRCRVTSDTQHFGALDPHHVVPRGAGGKDERRNLMTACRLHHMLIQQHRLWVQMGPLGTDGELTFTEEP